VVNIHEYTQQVPNDERWGKLHHPSEQQVHKTTRWMFFHAGIKRISMIDTVRYMLRSEKKEVKSLSAMGVINVVRTVWLEDCERQKKELPVHHRHVAYDLLLPKDTISSTKGSVSTMSDPKQGKPTSIQPTLPNNQFQSVTNVFSHWNGSCLQVTVNSGKVVFFRLFNHKESGEFLPKEATTVIKIASSRMAKQSNRFGCEFAKWLGVKSPQVIIPSDFLFT
nr:DNA topoisomerase 2-binding protein 1 isoform X1 [Tanacetum cinerariifolium]